MFRNMAVEGIKGDAEKADFGSPQYRALSDYIELKLLREGLLNAQKNLNSAKDPTERNLYKNEVQLQVLEIAFLRHSIRESERDIKGYDKAHIWIKSQFDSHLAVAIDDEVSRSPIGEELTEEVKKGIRKADRRDLYEEVFGMVQDVIYRKRE